MILFEVHAVTCITVRTTESYWRYIVITSYRTDRIRSGEVVWGKR